MRQVSQSVIGLFLLLFFIKVNAQQADLILVNGKVFTSDNTKTYAEAIAIRGDRIMAVGSKADVAKLAGSKTKTIDLGGRTVILGINDAHDHVGFGTPFGKHIAFTAPMLPGPSFQDVLDSLAIAVEQAPKGTLIQGDLGQNIRLNEQ